MLDYNNKAIRSLARALANEDNSGCTCYTKRGEHTRNPNCPIHAEDVNRKVIVEIEAPVSYGTMERVYPTTENLI